MNCLSTDSLIMTESGLKQITEIKKGEKVWAFDQKTYQPVLKKCTGVFDNGRKKVYEIETIHQNIKATSNHPFLVLKRNKNKENEFVWKTVTELKKDDEIVTLKKKFYKNLDINKNLKNDYKIQNNHYFIIRKIKNIIPRKIEQTLDLRVEGEHNFIANGIVVHNTGNQRSSATPYGASTTTTPSGKVSFGKEKFQKDLAQIIIAHNIPYVATANPEFQIDMYEKMKKAFETKGPSFILIFAACPTNMKADPSETFTISKMATETNYFPLYEYENRKYKINYKPFKKVPIEEFLKLQTKFREVLKDKKEIKIIQEHVDEKWNSILKKEEK
ncbi:MAG: thiamine pyrophosphate-dependent enzyme [Candidatus ainarchaeum sp.]|nr:thiamine pyrophosphate-dependent enzyme [Candidatus ainarchaeum sp.]